MTVQGVGIAYHPEFRSAVLDAWEVDFVEVFAERYFDRSGAAAQDVDVGSYPVVLHCLGLSLGSAEPLDAEYVSSLAQAVHRVRPAWYSDHLAITSIAGARVGHLAPVPLTEETVANVCAKVKVLQRSVAAPFLLENIASPFRFSEDELPEWELYRRILERADCGMLLDLNNLYANALNFGYDPLAFLEQIPLERVVEVHLAGGAFHKEVFVDTHAHPVGEQVWQLLEYVGRHSPVKAAVLERDKNFEPIEQLVDELRRARVTLKRARDDVHGR